MRSKLIEGKRLEWLMLLFFVFSYIIISIFHEHWFDEAQAWEIAKGASTKEILTVIPHYEGHPPLWHLILAVPAKLGVPFELGLKAVGTIISTISAFFLMFYTKLPRVARVCIPFSYFFFYQYGVIIRPYGLMILVLMLLGENLSNRKEHPWKITGMLAALCLCSAYGIVIAGGIAICLVIEILQEKRIKKAFASLFKDSRSLSMLILLILALLILLVITPKPDTYYAAYKDRNPFIICLICALFTFPAECFLTSSSWFSMDRTLLQTSNIGIIELLFLCAIGAIIWGLIICSASKKVLNFL